MIRSVQKLKGFSVQATDGEIGKVDELYFDEQNWRVRYLIIDVGNWLFGRQVLIAPLAVSRIDTTAQKLFLDLTKEQIENSPEVATNETVSRAKERALHNHYQWVPYWSVSVHDPMIYPTTPPILAETAVAAQKTAPSEKEQLVKDALNPQNTHLRSTAEVCGYYIQAQDGDLGQVKDFLFDDQEWVILHMVVDTGKWLPGRKVLIAPPWIERILWVDRKVYVTLTKDSVRHSPPFSPDLLDMEAYEAQLLEHYRSWFSYLLKEDTNKENDLFLGKDIMGNPIITVSDGRSIGKVKDVYLDNDCRSVTGIYLGTEGLFSRHSYLIKKEDVVTIGKDAVLVKHPDVIVEEDDIEETEERWLRRDDLQGRPVDTSGGTKVGKIGDVVINRDSDVMGFSLSRVYVAGPIADNHSIAIHTVQDVGEEDGKMTVNLEQAEQQELSVV